MDEIDERTTELTAKNGETLENYLAKYANYDAPVAFMVKRLRTVSEEFSGYLGCLYIARDEDPSAMIADLFEKISEQWGGGVFSVSPKIKAKNGQLRFGSGFNLQIAGPPMHSPVRHHSQPGAPSMSIAVPTATNDMGGLAGVLQSLVENILQKPAMGQSAPAAPAQAAAPDIGAVLKTVIGALQQLQMPKQIADPYEQFERMMKLMHAMRTGLPPGEDADESDGLGKLAATIAPIVKSMFGGAAQGPVGKVRKVAIPKTPPPPPGWELSRDGTRFVKVQHENDIEEQSENDTDEDVENDGTDDEEPMTPDEAFEEIGRMSPDAQLELMRKFQNLA